MLLKSANFYVIMTDSNIYYQGFMNALQEKIPHKATLVNNITDILVIDKDAVYRRLRGEVNFSFTEMALIAKNLGISLDNIARIENFQTKPSTVNISRQVNPTELDYEMFEGHVNLLKSIKDEPDTKIMEAANIFPHYLYQDFDYLTRFYRFRWNQASKYGNLRPFHETIEPERLRKLQYDTGTYSRHIKSTLYVLDHLIFQRLVTNIRYFARIHLIRADDVALIKKDLMAFVDYLENIAVKGKYEDTGNEVSIYISDINFETNYSCLKTKNITLTLFRIFILNAVVSFDGEIFNETSAWIYALQRMSTMISVSGEKVRSIYFETQRKAIDTL